MDFGNSFFLVMKEIAALYLLILVSIFFDKMPDCANTYLKKKINGDLVYVKAIARIDWELLF